MKCAGSEERSADGSAVTGRLGRRYFAPYCATRCTVCMQGMHGKEDVHDVHGMPGM